ncbi:hypothetical protein EDD90_10225 [Streptomyces sp. Ag109_O5-1]|nr:hypothetical protein [Streptomyces sp. Ag109_O5-1]RPE46850.1 hypothetical protein EDD90_10225 [Streptomyces sp. Ag109_O5-1]
MTNTVLGVLVGGALLGFIGARVARWGTTTAAEGGKAGMARPQ